MGRDDMKLQSENAKEIALLALLGTVLVFLAVLAFVLYV